MQYRKIDATNAPFHLGMLHAVLIRSVRLEVSPAQWRSHMDLLVSVACEKDLEITKVMDLYKAIPVSINNKLRADRMQLVDINSGNVLCEITNLAIPTGEPEETK